MVTLTPHRELQILSCEVTTWVSNFDMLTPSSVRTYNWCTLCVVIRLLSSNLAPCPFSLIMADVRRPDNGEDTGPVTAFWATLRVWLRAIAAHEDLAVTILIYVYGVSVVW